MRLTLAYTRTYLTPEGQTSPVESLSSLCGSSSVSSLVCMALSLLVVVVEQRLELVHDRARLGRACGDVGEM